MLLKAFADESGVHGAKSPITLVAAYLAPDNQWAAFDAAWQSLLAGYGLRTCHAVELAHSKGVFKSWKTINKQAFLEQAATLIGQHGLLGLSAWFSNADYDQFYKAGPAPKKQRLYSRYAIAVMCLAERLASVSTEFKAAKKVDLVVAEGSPGAGDAPLAWDWFKNDGTDMNSKLGDLTFAQHQNIAGLQAADLFMYAAYHHLSRQSPIAQFASSWQLFIGTDKARHIDAHATAGVLQNLRTEAFRLDKNRMELGGNKLPRL